MKVPLSWLAELVELGLPVPQLARRLTMAGLEVEEVHVVGSDLRDVALARVVDLERHPRADHLYVAKLDRGDRQATIVTAATNLAVGAVVAHVAPGGRLPGGEAGNRAFQGITSEGMVCSGDELNVSPDKDRIYLWEDTAAVGQQVAEYLGETIFDIYITANRPDCMSMVGIAREVHALTGGAYRPAFEQVLHPAAPVGDRPVADLVDIQIDDPVGCPRFVASVVQGITLKASPPWLQRRLHFAGVRPISNVVDVTNYVMLELGQPLHAFDYRKLHGNPPRIVVRRARAGERLETLDGQTRTLHDRMMVVADTERARSLAGVMGGADSEISDTTSDVLLEGASWDRASIRVTSGELNLASEASRRFGRGVDPGLADVGVARATQLTLELAGGRAAAGLQDVYPGQQTPPTIRVRPAQIDALLGYQYPREQVVQTLTSLDFRVDASDGDELRVDVPGHRRFDVERRADLAEEVARVAGYELIPTTMPVGRLPDPRPDGDGGYADELRARRLLAAAGLQEVITYSLSDPALGMRLSATDDAVPEAGAAIPIANPMSVEQSVLRFTLLGGLLETARASSRAGGSARIFELARTWRGPMEPLPAERRTLGIVLVGAREDPHWTAATGTGLDFFDLKGVVETVAAAFGARDATYAPAQHPALHAGRTATLALADGEPVGILGQLHPRVARRFDFEDGETVLVAELNFDALAQANAARGLLAVQTPSRFPAADRDVAVVVAEPTPHAALDAAIRAAAGPLLRDVRLFDVYRGPQVPPGHKSLAFALTYQASDRTLGDEEVAAAHAAVEQALRTRFSAEIRGREAR